MPKNGNLGSDMDLSSHALRSRLPPRAEPYWVPTKYKRLSVGYQCTPEEGSRWARAGVARWVGRLWNTERRAYSHKVLGIPDDADATTGVINPVLRPISFAEALEAASAWARDEGDPLDLRPEVSPKPNGTVSSRSKAKPMTSPRATPGSSIEHRLAQAGAFVPNRLKTQASDDDRLKTQASDDDTQTAPAAQTVPELPEAVASQAVPPAVPQGIPQALYAQPGFTVAAIAPAPQPPANQVMIPGYYVYPPGTFYPLPQMQQPMHPQVQPQMAPQMPMMPYAAPPAPPPPAAVPPEPPQASPHMAPPEPELEPETKDGGMSALEEAADLLRVHYTTASTWARKGLLPGAVRIGRRWRVKMTDLREAMAACQPIGTTGRIYGQPSPPPKPKPVADEVTSPDASTG